MTQSEILALKVNDRVGYQASPDDAVIPATVTQNGPRLDVNGVPVPHLNDLFAVQLGDSAAAVSWEPVSFPAGIPQIVAAPPSR